MVVVHLAVVVEFLRVKVQTHQHNKPQVWGGRALRPPPIDPPPHGGRRLGVHHAQAVRPTAVVQLYHAHYMVTFILLP